MKMLPHFPTKSFLKFRYAISVFCAAFLLSYGCNGNENQDVPESSTQGPVTNVNGNIPDTSNTVDLNSRPIDSSHISNDSLK